MQSGLISDMRPRRLPTRAGPNTPAYDCDSATSNAYVTDCTTPVITATRGLFLRLQRSGVTPILITGRPESQRDGTTSCLESLGVSGWQALVMRAEGDDRPAPVYKAQARKGLQPRGWKIGPSTGDQISDMSFGHLGHGFLLPNPMYLIP